MKTPKYYQDIIDVIKEHKEMEDAISQRELCILFNIKDTQLRHAILDARQDGVFVLSDNEHGYWFSEDPEERNAFLRRGYNRIKTTKRYLDKLKKGGTSNAK